MTDSPRDYVDKTEHRDRIVSQRKDMKDRKSIIDKYSYQYFGGLFDGRQEFMKEYQSTLRSAHITESADLYLGKTILYTILTFTVVLILSLIGMGSLFLLGLLEIFTPSVIGQVIIALGTPLFASIVISSILGALMYIYPSYKASRRASAIDATLPSAVTFMYALNRGGMNVVEVMRVLSENEEVYGEVSNEVATIIQDMEYFSRDLMEALRRAGDRSPSQKFIDLMDDLVATVDAGASTATFFRDKSEDLIDEAERDQANFIETLSLLGEVYVTAFVAGPLFMIIITVIMSMLGGADPSQLDGIVYGLLPFMNVGYFFLINILSGQSAQTAKTIKYTDESSNMSDTNIDDFLEQNDSDSVRKVKKAKKKRERMALVREPISELIREPDKTLLFTVPIAIVYVILAPIIGLAEISIETMISNPVTQTFYWLLIPLLIVSVPLSIFYEIGMRREKKMMNRLPESLKTLASANKVGMTLTESLENAADNTTGRLGDELKRVKNDIKWNHDVNKALIKLANRIQIPILTRTVKLITEANSSTGDIESVISIAAKNVETQVRLEKQRSRSMLMYTAVIIISFTVYMFVVALLDLMFLSTIGDFTGSDFGSDGGFQISDLPVERFRLVFYHSTIVQAFGSGMIAGYLSSNNVRSGLKFAIILSLIASLVFYAL